MSVLPTLNACLNATAAAAILTGVLAIRRRHVAVHRAAMLTAFAVSTAFLVSYLVYHYQTGSRRFEGPGWLLEERWSDPLQREQLLDAARLAEAEPSLLGASAHLMAVARKEHASLGA